MWRGQRVSQWQFAAGKALCKALPWLAQDARISAVKRVAELGSALAAHNIWDWSVLEGTTITSTTAAAAAPTTTPTDDVSYSDRGWLHSCHMQEVCRFARNQCDAWFERLGFEKP